MEIKLRFFKLELPLLFAVHYLVDNIIEYVSVTNSKVIRRISSMFNIKC